MSTKFARFAMALLCLFAAEARGQAPDAPEPVDDTTR